MPLIENMFDLIRFFMLERFQDFTEFSRSHHRIFPFLLKTIETEDCFGPTKILEFDPPNTKIPHPSNNIQYFFKNICDLVGII